MHYLALNCRNITATTINEELNSIRMVGGTRIIHLEEAPNLSRLKCDEMLTEFMGDDDFATCRWFATGVRDHGLDGQFRRRWTVKATTSPPEFHAAASMLARCCRDYHIKVDHPATFELLAQRSWCVLGLALGLLGPAIIRGELTRNMVLTYPFPESDPWRGLFFEV